MKWFCYPTGDEADLWAHWFAQQRKRAQARHATVMRFLSAGHWKAPHYRDLVGEHQGLGEIKISAEVEWRLIGRRDQQEDSFTLLIICHHKGKVYTPTNALDTALARWRKVEIGLKRIERNDPPA